MVEIVKTDSLTSIISRPSKQLRLRVFKTDLFELVMIEYLFMLGLFSRWVEHSRIWRLVLVLLIFILFCQKIFAREVGRFISSFWVLTPVVLFVCSIIVGESRAYLFLNFNRLLWPLLIATSIAIIISTKPDVVFLLFDRNFLFLNCIWIINIIVLTIQCTGTPFLIKSSWLEVNPFYKDQCCGLFGNSGTHELSAFSIFMIIYDLYIGYFRRKGIQKWIIIVFAIVTAAIMLLLSTKNDNMALLFILPLFVMLFYLQKAHWSGSKPGTKIMGMLKYICPVLLLLLIVSQFPSIKSFIYDKVIGRLDRMINFNSTGVLGSNVRIASVIYAFNEGKGWLFGYGVGTWPFAEGTIDEYFHGFSNFGLNSMSTYIMLGGIWLYLATTCLFARYLHMATYGRKKSGSYFIICLFVIIVFSFYTVIFNSFQSMLWLMMTFIVFGFCRDCILINKRK